jgi:hypothetical protein
MITKTNLNIEILKMNLFIGKYYPELSNFILELPVTNPDTKNPIINLKYLLSYYESLISIVKQYQKAHDIKLKK